MNICSYTFQKICFSRKLSHVYSVSSSFSHEAPCCVPLKLQSVDPGDQGPQRFRDHLFIHAIRSLIQGPAEPRLAAALSQQLSGNHLAHVLRSHDPAACYVHTWTGM